MRTYIVTGSAGQIGKAAQNQLEAAGHRVIGVDLALAEVAADIATPQGRLDLVAGVRALTDTVDGVLAIAGTPGTNGDPANVISTNFFGTVATLEGLRPLLARSDKPRALAVSSIGGVMAGWDETLVRACLSGTEAAALTLKGARSNAGRCYSSVKRALAHWVRSRAISEDWAGRGIVLNCVAPGVIMAPERMANEPALQELTQKLLASQPLPFGRVGSPDEVASLMVWLTSAANGYTTGQVIFTDGGWEVVTRGVAAWDANR